LIKNLISISLGAITKETYKEVMFSPQRSSHPQASLNFLSCMAQIASQPITFEGTTIVVHDKVLGRLNFSLQKGIEESLKSLPEGYLVERR
jgi:hypothetical protein